MSIKIEKTEQKNEVKLEFSVEAEKFVDAIKKVYAKSAKLIAIPGFRKGKAPFAPVEKRYGDAIFYEDAFNDLVPEIYEKALTDNKIAAVNDTNNVDPPFATDIEHKHTRQQNCKGSQMQANSLNHNRTV